MAVNLNPTIKQKVQPLFSESAQFRRSRERTDTSKIHRKIRLKFSHILISFLFLCSFFLGIQQGYLYLITCSEFQIKSVEIECGNSQIKTETQSFIQGRSLGNLFLLDMQKLKQSVISHPRIKDVRIRKLFPSSLKIMVEERIPAAVMKKNRYLLVDRDGVVLAESEQRFHPDLPLLVDEGNFQKNPGEKLSLAWRCLKEFELDIRNQVDTMDFSRYNNVTVKLRSRPERLILGNEGFSHKIKSFLNNLSLFSSFGEIRSIDLRFPDRFILTPRNRAAGIQYPGDRKEES